MLAFENARSTRHMSCGHVENCLSPAITLLASMLLWSDKRLAGKCHDHDCDSFNKNRAIDD